MKRLFRYTNGTALPLAVVVPLTVYRADGLMGHVDTIYKTFFFSFLSPSGTVTSRYAKNK